MSAPDPRHLSGSSFMRFSIAAAPRIPCGIPGRRGSRGAVVPAPSVGWIAVLARGCRAGLAALFLWVLPASVLAQDTGTVSGVVVSSWDGAQLASVAVTVRGTTLATQSDASGRYQLNGVPPGEHALRFSKSGFASAVVTDARVLAGQTTTVNGSLRPEFFELEEYEVTAEEFTQQADQIMVERQKSSTMMEALGSDFLSRVGAGNAAESITKVSGATIVEGKFAVIRGLSDRYVSTTLNGASIPSANPYRQSASLDLFPSQVIDRVVVAKTFTPDQPGAFTGGGIDIVTKSFPEKAFFSGSIGTAYNTQASLNDRSLGYKGGGLDWLGVDDGTRALPDALVGKVIPSVPISTGPTNSANYKRILGDAVQLDQLTRALGPTDFAPRREAAPLNHNLSLSGGGTTKVLDGPLGYFAGLSYKHDYSSYENGVSRRYQQGTEVKNSYRDARSLSVTDAAAMINLAYRPFEEHELGFLFFYNQNGTDEARIQDQGYEANDPTSTFRRFNLYWTERNLNTYQTKGEHRFPDAGGLKFNWLVALTQTTQDEPDARFFNDNDNHSGRGYETGANNPIPKDPTRYFRTLDEHNRNVKLDWTLPFQSWVESEGLVKAGFFDSQSQRGFDDRAIFYPGTGGYMDDPNQFLAPGNLGLVSSRTNGRNGNVTFNFGHVIQAFDSRYDGDQGIRAGYLMGELPLVGKLRLVAGARYETTDLGVRSESYLASSVTGLRTNRAEIVGSDILPSVGLVYGISSNMNVRLNFSQTIARPSFREVAAYYGYDPTIGDFIEGNPELRMSSIQNYDLRWEWFPSPGSLLSASVFYKDLKDAIERGDRKVDAEVITYLNRPSAKLYGLELEGRRDLGFLGDSWKEFSLGGNLALVQSEVKLSPEELASKRPFFPGLKDTRPLYDQSPYIANVDLAYDNPRTRTTAALILNVAGPRIAITKLNADDVYEQPAPTLDFVLSQKVGRHATIKFSAKNLLDPEFERTYGKNSSLLYSSYTKGRAFGLSLNYDF
ncbi:MAG: TonB-dependent receptor plug domain-containing protein [Verrucomicrobia bacterium]|nr:MAG: TonB-dependent receptor plug domain-containing protein [Verrucomicrobiota bacterium]